jgi:hypothetical protein
MYYRYMPLNIYLTSILDGLILGINDRKSDTIKIKATPSYLNLKRTL